MENEIAEQETETKEEKKEREKLEKAERDFVQGRIEGRTIQELSDKLWIAEETCKEWDLRHYSEIKTRKILQVETNLKKNKVTRIERIETTSLILSKLKKELAKRDFKDIPTNKLILLTAKMEDFLYTQLENTGSDFKRL